MTITEIAAEVGVNKSTVSRQARRHNLVGPDGKVELDDYRRLREGGLDPALQTTGRQAIGSGNEANGELADARRRKLAAEAEQAELDLAKRRGELVERAAVAEALSPLLRKLRDDLLTLPRDHIADPGLSAQLEDAIAGLLERTSVEILTNGGAAAA
jgi:DNA-binding MurR/RpiR family transcriptional regulator